MLEGETKFGHAEPCLDQSPRPRMKLVWWILSLSSLASAELVVNVKLSQTSSDTGFDFREDNHERSDDFETVGSIR